MHDRRFPQHDLEIIFVDDGSDDQSWSVLADIQNQDPAHVVVLKLSRNFGQLYAIIAGYEAARGDAVIMISADLQDPIELMGDLVTHWGGGKEVVIACRESRDDDVAATLFSRIAYGVARIGNPTVPSGGFDYLLMSRRAIRIFLSNKSRHRFFQGDVLWMGLPTVFIPYRREKRLIGKSGWTLKKKYKYFIDLVLDSSYLPIRVMSALGVLTTASGFFYSLLIVISWWRNGTPFVGWAPIMIAILLVGGVTMTMLGVIGEYVWRMYDDVKQRPLYVVEREQRGRQE